MSLFAIIDDDEPFLDLMRDLFEGEGYRVIVGRVLDGALDLLRATPPDLIVLDLTVGAKRVAGLALLQTLRADPQFLHLPIIVVSAAPDLLVTHAVEFARLNAVTLAKPFDLPHLIALVESLTSAATGTEQHGDGGLLPASLPTGVTGESSLLLLVAFAVLMLLLLYR